MGRNRSRFWSRPFTAGTKDTDMEVDIEREELARDFAGEAFNGACRESADRSQP